VCDEETGCEKPTLSLSLLDQFTRHRTFSRFALRIGTFFRIHLRMTHIVTEPCIKCKHTDCVSVCPVDCFHEGPNFIVIDPAVCIDCGLCVRECPVDAIYDEVDLPEKWVEYGSLNTSLSTRWPSLIKPKSPLASAEEFKDIQDKRHLLDLSDEDKPSH